MLLAEQALDRVDLNPQARAEHVRARAVHRGEGLMTQTTDRAAVIATPPRDDVGARRRQCDRAARTPAGPSPPRSRTCARCKTREAGGRASCAPTSRWTPRTCCCASSSASAPTETEEAARWIRSQQRTDGTWATFDGGPADLSTTVEA